MKPPNHSKSVAGGKNTSPPVSASARNQLASIRPDLLRAGILVFVTLFVWCLTYNKWTAASWSAPLAYTADMEKSDVVALFAGIKATSQGHVLPFMFTNVPELGAPFAANWDDYPLVEKPLIIFTGAIAKIIGVFAAVNFVFMLEALLAVISFYAACRILKCSWAWSFAFALVFAFTRYYDAHGIHHITVSYFWHIPLCLVVCGWMFEEEGLALRDRRFIFALAVAFITAVQNVYYTNMFCQFVLFAGLVQWWRRRDWRAALPAAVIIGTTAFWFLLMNANTFAYHMAYGPNHGAVVRAYKWLEIYALKIVDLIIPPPDHHLTLFGQFGAWHISNAVLPPGELPPTAYIGLVGLAVMIWLVASTLKRVLEGTRLALESWQITWILFYAAVGGINSVIGSFGFQLFRSTTRYSIFIACIVLMYAVKRLSAFEFRKNQWLTYVLPVVMVLIALWDELPPQVTNEKIEETNNLVVSDRKFTEEMELNLPPNAMVFQIPIMEFPESPVPGVAPYDHFRPYLYSNHLHFSFGSDKGRPKADWSREFAGASVVDVISRLEKYGFSAVYVNRAGFPDKGEGLLNAFKQAGRDRILESDRKDLVCVFLKPSAQPVLPPGGNIIYH